jgi:ring-1,2-phenylacetyl-CoA epoxidase subunit PaaC
MHANTWISQLSNSTGEAKERLQKSLEEALPYALGIFEPSKFEKEIVDAGIYPGEKAIEEQWKENIAAALEDSALSLPDWNSINPVYGGRYGKHTEHLQPLLEEMSEVFRVDPTADW